MPIIQAKNLGMKKEKTSIYSLIVRICLILIVFLIPLYFLPSTSEVIEINKTFLFYVLVLIATVFWFFDLSLNKEKTLWSSPLRTPLMVFGVIFLISSIFSYHVDSSLIGLPGYYHHSLLSIIFFIIFFFLLVNSIQGKEGIKKLLGVFLVSSVIASVFSFLQIFKLHILPWDVTKFANFNLVSNSISSFSIYLALVFITALVFLIISQKKWHKILLLIYVVFTFVTLLIIGVKTGLYALIIGLVLLLFFLTVKAKEISVRWTTVTALFLAFSIVFLFVSVSDTLNVEIQKDIVLDQATTLEATKGSLGKNLLFGSGPGTFYYDLTRFRPLSFNNTQYWNLNFIKGASEWWQTLSTTGILGLLSYLALFAFFFISLVKEFYKTKLEGERGFLLILFLSGASLIFFSGIFYTYSFTLMFMLFLFFALGMIMLRSKEREIRVGEMKITGLFSSLSLSLVIIFAIVVIYFSGRILLADVYYSKASQAISKQEDLTKVEDYLIKSIDLNSRQPNYYFSMAQNYSVMAQLASQQPNFDPNQMQKLISLALVYADKGINLAQNDPAAHLSLANLYQEINLITSDDISNLVLESYNKAIELEPNNPFYHYSLGNYYVVLAQSVQNALENVEEAQKEAAKAQAKDIFNSAIARFQKAAELKKNYAVAEAAIALTHELSGDIEIAVSGMAALTQKYPLDFSLFYELGRMYLNQDKLDEAALNFQKVISLFPGNSNAHWQLSIVYEKQDKKDLATEEMEIVNQLNPDNEAVKARLKLLKGE